MFRKKPKVTSNDLGKVLTTWIIENNIREMIMDKKLREELDILNANSNQIYLEGLALYLFITSLLINRSKLDIKVRSEVITSLHKESVNDIKDRLGLSGDELNNINDIFVQRNKEYTQLVEQNAQPNFLYWLAKTCLQKIKDTPDQLGLSVTMLMSARISAFLTATPKLINSYSVSK